MMVNEIKTSIKTVYGMLWDVLALYEKIDCYNELPGVVKRWRRINPQILFFE